MHFLRGLRGDMSYRGHYGKEQDIRRDCCNHNQDGVPLLRLRMQPFFRGEGQQDYLCQTCLGKSRESGNSLCPRQLRPGLYTQSG